MSTGMTPMGEIKTARKRCVSMGVHRGWRADFAAHPLAACISNLDACIEVETRNFNRNHLAILVWIYAMAVKINEFCDASKVAGDTAAEYWLEYFLWVCDTVCEVSIAPG
jgi:hypothetical protein